MDFMRRIFRIITATPAERVEGRAPHFTTYGHDDNYCAGVNRDRIIAQNRSLSDWLADNEYFDGELTYAEPWPCELCITLEKLEQEEKRFKPQVVPPQAPVPQTNVQTRINIDIGETSDASEIDQALAFVRTIRADEKFDFLKAMRAKYDDNPNWTPTPKQAAAILKCAKRNKPRQSQPKPAPTPETSDGEKKPVEVKNPDAPVTEKQVEWLVKLASEKTPDFFKRVGETEVRARAQKLTRGEASAKISEMMKMPRPKQATA